MVTLEGEDRKLARLRILIEIRRRAFLTGLVSLVAAPAIVRIESIMPVRALKLDRHPLYDSDAYQHDREAFYGRSPCMDDLPSLQEINERLIAAMRDPAWPPPTSVQLFKGRVAMLENWPGHARR